MGKIRNICVYCGSGSGTNPAFAEAAHRFGEILADNGIGLVYGGGNVGIMGEIAQTVLANGGKVTGIIPEFLVQREHANRAADYLIITRDMHERKRKMFEHADAFVALPGGVGTLEELVEQLTWAQLGRHKKPILIANIEGFWRPLCELLDHMKDTQFIRAGLDFKLLVADTVADILPKLNEAIASVGEDEKVMKEAQPQVL
ncbi:MAG TPA: TIGR00730 family Rossman fold protein [Pseudolabrys sp.]|nr:TIGR00730 family Rossman fold protein [Pseudolabrys sp.]